MARINYALARLMAIPPEKQTHSVLKIKKNRKLFSCSLCQSDASLFKVVYKDETSGALLQSGLPATEREREPASSNSGCRLNQ